MQIDTRAMLHYRTFAAGGRPMLTQPPHGGHVIVLDVKGILDRIARPRNIETWQR